jgi:hypothetical protein
MGQSQVLIFSDGLCLFKGLYWRGNDFVNQIDITKCKHRVGGTGHGGTRRVFGVGFTSVSLGAWVDL